jgi:hypothetical protein
MTTHSGRSVTGMGLVPGVGSVVGPSRLFQVQPVEHPGRSGPQPHDRLYVTGRGAEHNLCQARRGGGGGLRGPGGLIEAGADWGWGSEPGVDGSGL